MNEDKFLSVAEVAGQQGVRTETVLRWIHNGWEDRGKLPASRYPNRQWYVTKADLEAFLQPVAGGG